MSAMTEYTLEIYKSDKRTKEGRRLVAKEDFAPTTNTPVVFGRGSIYKYEVNPVNNMKVCPPCFDYEGASRANTQNSRRAEAPKRDSTV